MNSIVESKITFYKKDIDNPFSVNGFKGTWNFSDHALIPDVLNGFLQRYFGQYRIRRIPLDKINEVLNEIWEGPGSLEKVFRLEEELRASGRDVKFTTADLAAIKAKKNEEDDLPLMEDFDFDFEIDANEEE